MTLLSTLRMQYRQGRVQPARDECVSAMEAGCRRLLGRFGNEDREPGPATVIHLWVAAGRDLRGCIYPRESHVPGGTETLRESANGKARRNSGDFVTEIRIQV